MPLDTETLRVALVLVCVCVFSLFLLGTYRSTRTAFSGWWCLALAGFVLSSVAYLANGSAVQQWANPLGNVLAVLGAGSMWTAARSLAGSGPRWSVLLGLPALAGLVAALDDPAHDVWTGGAVFLAAMATGIGLSAWALRCARADAGGEDRAYAGALTALLVASAATAVFYAARFVGFVAVGPDHPAFVRLLGSAPTTLIVMMLLVVVTFSMTSLSHAQQTRELQALASADALTGTLNRRGFAQRVQSDLAELRRGGRVRGALLMADLDHFKTVNDRGGHAAGDQALQRFAECARTVLGPQPPVGRWGGDEFVVLLPDADEQWASSVAREINRRFAAAGRAAGFWPTVSWGIAALAPGASLDDLVARADEHLYAGKRDGRDRIVADIQSRVEPRVEPGVGQPHMDPDSGSAAEVR